MGEKSTISWTHSTHNEWIGCAHVSPGCERCYAENLMAKRWKRVGWGPGEPRSLTAEENRRKPHSWNKTAERDGRPWRVFSASLSDWLDHEMPAEWLAGLLDTVAETPALSWLLLTKRIARWAERLQAVSDLAPGLDDPTPGIVLARAWLGGEAPQNVWLGTTVEDQRRADERVPLLVQIPARVRFLSCEPLLGPVRLNTEHLASIHQVIVGGESQPGCRPMDLAWARALCEQVRGAGVRTFVKQLGGHPNARHDIDEFPVDLALREVPS